MPPALAFVFIYIGSWCYVLAQYYHLHLANWTFFKAIAIALPLVLLEYTFALNGTKLASSAMSPVQILIMTIGFYLLNIIILNVFLFKAPFHPVRDVIAIAFIFAAIFISSNVRL